MFHYNRKGVEGTAGGGWEGWRDETYRSPSQRRQIPFLCTHFNLQAQQRCAERLALGVGAERNGTAATESAVQQKVQSAQIGQFVTFDWSFDEGTEVGFDAVGRQLAEQDRVVALLPGDDADVAGVAL